MGIVALMWVVEYGEDVPGREIIFRDGKWYDECHEQLGGESVRISRVEARELIGKEILLLSDEEKEDILISDTLSRIKEKLEILGFSWEEMQDWCEKCYMLGINPLPTLRSHLKDVCKVAFAYYSSAAICLPEEDTLVCWLDNSDGYSVTLQFCKGNK
jgi:hypothetical protein